jgi:hypothetical protein
MNIGKIVREVEARPMEQPDVASPEPPAPEAPGPAPAPAPDRVGTQ